MKKIDSEEIYRDGMHYDSQHRNFKDDIPFYLKMVKEFGDPVLELACGTGRITLPLAEEGIDIIGLDISEGMLDQAKKKAQEKNLKIEFIKDDCRTFKLDRKFKLIFIPFNSFAHIHDLESAENLFTRVKEHLTKDGRFIIDIFNPNPEFMVRDPNEKKKVFEYPDPYHEGNVVIYETIVYDKINQINRIKWYYTMADGKETVEELNMRIYYPLEIQVLLKYNGLKIEKIYVNFDCSEFNNESPKQLIICKV